MTAQATDTFLHESQEFDITQLSHETELFDPRLHGLSPSINSTGCWRGHVCHFTLNDNQLQLKTLWTNHGHPYPGWTEKRLPLPLLNGVKANERYDEDGFQDFHGRYDELDLDLAYTGDILISTDIVDDDWSFVRGHRRPWHFPRTLRLDFRNGQLVGQQDLSEVFRVFDDRYCTDGDFYGEKRRNGLRYLRRHLGAHFKF